ncbi:ABC transporter substrate-binding protein [Carboxylicivirga sp. N1Y90]|uniref:ABC transporter substrate-binding protein n=1 Tax=Carboxylicivirga fragile TaxID=3417571 RepID=UPI003D33ED41|nr:ABC transporter substrate-binding protein [Marinilabiliaceae bacterium N1Y90]
MKLQHLLILILSVFTLACSNTKNKEQKSIQFTDSRGNKLKLKSVPQRIISCSPAITEVMFALNEQHKLVGRTNFCNYPQEALDIKAIGGLMDPSLEIMLQLKPDLVMASTHFKKEAANRIEELGMPFAWLMSQESVAGAGDLIINIGTLIGEKEKADSLWNLMQNSMQATMNQVPKNVKKPSVYYAVGFGKGGDYTAGSDTFISELITMAGGNNIASDITGWAYNLEALIQKDPDIILIQHSMKEAFCQHEHYNQLRAVKNNKVFAVDHHLVQLNGPRIHIALKTFAEIFYPELNHL